MAVVDPLLGGTVPRTHGIGRLRQFFPSLPLLVYTELAPATAGVLLELGRTGIRRVVVHRFEDAPGSLRSALLAELEQSASQQVIHGLGAHSPRSAARAAARRSRACCTRPGDGPTVTALADRARLTRRTCERWFTKVGTAVAAGGHGADPAAVRAPAAARSGLHGRGRGAQAGLQQDQDAADAPARGVRADRRRAPGVALAPTRRWPPSPAATSPPLRRAAAS